MVEIIVASIAGTALIVGNYVTVRNSHKNKKDLAVSNGHTPGFMIEQTYTKILDLDHKLNLHVKDQQAHCHESHEHFEGCTHDN